MSARLEQLSPEELRLVNEKRRNRGWSPPQLAARAGVSESSVSRLLGGRRVAISTIHAVAQALLQHPPRPEMVALFQPDRGEDDGQERRPPPGKGLPLQVLRQR